MKLVLDTNCFVDALSTIPSLGLVIEEILKAHRDGLVSLYVSRHTLAVLEKKLDASFDLAKTLPVLPHWPIGAWDDQAGTWEQEERKNTAGVSGRLRLQRKPKR